MARRDSPSWPHARHGDTKTARLRSPGDARGRRSGALERRDAGGGVGVEDLEERHEHMAGTRLGEDIGEHGWHP